MVSGIWILDRSASPPSVKAIVTPGNVHDSHLFQPLVERVIEKIMKPLAVAPDAAYKTPAITNYPLENQMLPGVKTTLRGLENKSMQATLIFAAMNLKKLATWTWREA